MRSSYIFSPDKGEKSPHRIASLALLFLVTLTFYNTLLNGFSYDDHAVILDNQRNLGNISNVYRLFTIDYFFISKEATYRPLVTISYMLDQYVWGLNPLGFHLTNLLLHLINSLLVYHLFIRLSGNGLLSVFSTTLWAVNPVLTEAVNSVGFREDLMAAMFVFLAVLLYLRGRLALSIFCYGFALLSKESAFPLLLLIAVYDYLYRDKLIIRRYTGYLLIAAGYLYLRFYLFNNPAEEFMTAKLPLFSRLISIPAALYYYIKLLLFPVSLTADYATFTFVTNPSFLIVLLILCGGAAFLLLAINGRLDKTAIFGMIWLFLFLGPVLNLIPIIKPFAERFLYLPAIGFALFFGNLNVKGDIGEKRVFFLLGIVLLFSALSYHRNTIWQDDDTLWQDTLAKYPNSYTAVSNLSLLMTEKKEYDNAIALIKNYLRRQPAPALLYLNLGNAYIGQGDYKVAIKSYERAIHLDPFYMPARYNLIASMYEMKMESRALEESKRALDIKPDDPGIHKHVGVIYANQGLFDEAIKEFRKALEVDQYIFEAHYNLGLVYEKKGMYNTASKEYIEELTINPYYNAAHLAMGRLYFNSGRPREAKREFLAVLREKPDNEEARLSLRKLREAKLLIRP